MPNDNGPVVTSELCSLKTITEETLGWSKVFSDSFKATKDRLLAWQFICAFFELLSDEESSVAFQDLNQSSEILSISWFSHIYYLTDDICLEFVSGIDESPLFKKIATKEDKKNTDSIALTENFYPAAKLYLADIYTKEKLIRVSGNLIFNNMSTTNLRKLMKTIFLFQNNTYHTAWIELIDEISKLMITTLFASISEPRGVRARSAYAKMLSDIRKDLQADYSVWVSSLILWGHHVCPPRGRIGPLDLVDITTSAANLVGRFDSASVEKYLDSLSAKKGDEGTSNRDLFVRSKIVTSRHKNRIKYGIKYEIKYEINEKYVEIFNSYARKLKCFRANFIEEIYKGHPDIVNANIR